MRFCFIAGCAVLTGAGALFAASDAPPRLTSVVRSDPRTGRLVRAVTVSGPERGRPVLARFVAETSARYDVDPLLVDSVIQVESNYDPAALSPKGAQGLMQLMPQTARRFAVRDTFNPWDNIEGGVRYLKYLLTMFGDRDPKLALAAYNAGEQAVLKHGGVPPYSETARYVDRVGKKLGEARRSAKPATRTQASNEPPRLVQYVDSAGALHIVTLSSP
jgi:soluble lytic murein transglycosylase-like protein